MTIKAPQLGPERPGAALDNRPTLHYRGEVSQDQLGQVVGPNAFGELYVFAEITYDPHWVPEYIPHCARETIHAEHQWHPAFPPGYDEQTCPGNAKQGRSTVRLRNATQPEVQEWQAIVGAGLRARVNA